MELYLHGKSEKLLDIIPRLRKIEKNSDLN